MQISIQIDPYRTISRKVSLEVRLLLGWYISQTACFPDNQPTMSGLEKFSLACWLDITEI